MDGSCLTIYSLTVGLLCIISEILAAVCGLAIQQSTLLLVSQGFLGGIMLNNKMMQQKNINNIISSLNVEEQCIKNQNQFRLKEKKEERVIYLGYKSVYQIKLINNLNYSTRHIMQQPIGKRTRYFSQFHSYQSLQKNISPSSLTVRPLQDPDSPPQIKLEELSTGIDDEIQLQLCQSELKTTKIHERSRSKSEDNAYTILGFLDRKIRQRIMSDQIKPIKQQLSQNTQ